MDLKKMRSVREAKGMTLRDLARKAGKSPATVSRHERGLKGASIDTVKAYAAALRMKRRWYALVGD